MGVSFKNLVNGKLISLNDLKNKTLAVDTFNLLYQFLTTIRSPDGSLLTNSKGEVTSHLIGLFSRLVPFFENGMKLIFVFDGKVPELKREERERRKQAKHSAYEKYKTALESEDIESMKKYAARSVVLNEDILNSAKELIQLFGCPIVQAPMEGEAQAAHLVKKQDAYAVVSQDYDSLIYGAPRFVKNLSLTGRKKKKGTLAYTITEPQLVTLSEVLNDLQIDLDQLIVLAILIGTDYDPKGVKGIGPKIGLKKVKEYGKDFDRLFGELEWIYPYSWKEVYNTIKNMGVTDDYSIKFKEIDYNGLIDFLVKRHGFNEERVTNNLNKICTTKNQCSLNKFF